jgi:hypothetical protein
MNFQYLYDWLYHQIPDEGGVAQGIPLKGTGIVVGLALLLFHLWGLVKSAQVIALAKSFPRSRPWGVVLLTIALVWSLFLIAHMDMADFFVWRQTLLMILPVAFVLVVIFVPEFLAVRALGSLMLLVAAPVLHAAFLQPHFSRLLLPILAYAWIIGGMFLVGMPYLLRDAIDWASKVEGRWKLAMLAGEVYGAVLFLVAIFLW